MLLLNPEGYVIVRNFRHIYTYLWGFLTKIIVFNYLWYYNSFKLIFKITNWVSKA